MTWKEDYEELKGDLLHCHWEDWSSLKWERLTKSIKKTIKKAGGIDYRAFPPDFRWHLCSSRMSQGKFHNYDGWQFRSDWAITFMGYNGGPKTGMIPKWDGRPVERLIVACEQGVGDEILYSSALPDLIVRLGHDPIELQCHPRLFEIFKRSFRIKVAPRRVLSQIEGDAVVALADLFMFYRRDKSHFPKKPFLKADQEKVEKWNDWLKDFPKPWVGVAWGSRKGIIEPDLFCKAVLEKHGGTLFDLQYRLPGYEYPEKPDYVNSVPFDIAEDKEESFAFVKALDLVVSTTQTITHVSGSQGVKTEVILPPKGTGQVKSMLWYYGIGNVRDHMVYGNMKVFDNIEIYKEAV